MNRTLRRPMFRMGGSTGTGITSGLDRKPLKEGTDPQDRTFKPNIEQALKAAELSKDPRVRDLLFPTSGGLRPGSLPGFLTSFGLNLASATPTGNIFQTAAGAAQQPFKTFQAAKLARADDQAKFSRDLFSGDIASQYDLEAQRIKNQKSDEKTFAKEQAAKAVSTLYDSQIGAIKNKIDQLDQANDPDYLEKINDLNNQIESIEDRKTDDIKSIYLSQKTIEEFQREAILKLLQNNDIEDIAPYFPNFEELMGGITIPEARADGGRIGYKMGTPRPMMETVVEEKQQTGEVQDLSYTELRSRLPQEISNEIVMLLANSKQALLDFANIQTGEDVASFNQQYDVNLTLPQGA
jgi:gas vesicle protein